MASIFLTAHKCRAHIPSISALINIIISRTGRFSNQCFAVLLPVAFILNSSCISSSNVVWFLQIWTKREYIFFPKYSRQNFKERVLFNFCDFCPQTCQNAINCAREGRFRPLKLQEGHFKVIPRSFNILNFLVTA